MSHRLRPLNHTSSERPHGTSPPVADPLETIDDKDRRIARDLAQLSDANDDYWTFRRGAARRQAHGLTQYPAMMVPPMQAALLAVVVRVDQHINSVMDPFCGAGTTLVESMRLGLSYSGQDVNPLAILLCRAKAGPFHVRRLTTAAQDVVRRAKSDRGVKIEANFPGLDKWFFRDAAIALSRIRRSIRREHSKWCRRVLWTTLAETVRVSSNSRTSTFKLHVRSGEELATRSVDALAIFTDVLSQIVTRLQDEAGILRKAGHLEPGGCYRGDLHIRLGNSMTGLPEVGHPGHDLLITSPPYGDNTSTVPYGQYSFLPLQWIDLHDIDGQVDSAFLASTYEIDSRSLGGTRKNALRHVKSLLTLAPSLATTLSRLAPLPQDRSGRIAAFCRDLDLCLGQALACLRPNAYMIWTVGNRHVGGKSVPTDAILSELLKARGARSIAMIKRRIPSKRMATRNSIATTMREESILVFRKA